MKKKLDTHISAKSYFICSFMILILFVFKFEIILRILSFLLPLLIILLGKMHEKTVALNVLFLFYFLKKNIFL